jgi:HSP20 family protein
MTQLIPWRGRTGWAPMERVRHNFERLFDRFFGGAVTPYEEDLEEMRVWDLDVDDADKEVIVRAEIPGFEGDEVDVSLRDNVLCIKAEKREKKDGEQRYRSFCRNVTLPAGLNADQAQANYRNGVLELHLPKSPQAGAKRIAVQSAKEKATPSSQGAKA